MLASTVTLINYFGTGLFPVRIYSINYFCLFFYYQYTQIILRQVTCISLETLQCRNCCVCKFQLVGVRLTRFPAEAKAGTQSLIISTILNNPSPLTFVLARMLWRWCVSQRKKLPMSFRSLLVSYNLEMLILWLQAVLKLEKKVVCKKQKPMLSSSVFILFHSVWRQDGDRWLNTGIALL